MPIKRSNMIQGGMILEKIVTAKELGKYLKLSDSTIYKLAANGEIPGFRIGDSWRFDMEEVIESINKKQQTKGQWTEERSESTEGKSPKLTCFDKVLAAGFRTSSERIHYGLD